MAASSPFTGTLNASTFSMTNTYDLSSPNSHSSSTPRSSQITSDDDDDNDQIVWYVSEGDMSSTSAELDEDFVVLTKPQSDLLTSVEDKSLEQQTAVSATKLLEMQMSTLSLSLKAKAKKPKKFKRSKKATASSVQDTTTGQQRNRKNFNGVVSDAYSSPAQSPKPADVLQAISAVEHLGFGQRPIVDDLSERLSVISGDKTPTVYEEASTYISAFLSNPDAQADDVCRLTLLQSLIIELGLATSSALPPTLSAAKAFLKSHAFLNIREYIAVRGQGPEAVQRVMYPTRSALIKSIKKKKNATSIKWVKELGLQVLLVGYIH
jgi:hypothetical protein